MTQTPDPAPTAIGTGSGTHKDDPGSPPYSSPHPPSQQFRIAVAAAIAAYAQSGRLGDAALTYGVHGFPIFPLSVSSKKPIPRRDPDPTGKHKKGIPGTGSFYKATTDPLIIRQWWTIHPEALIGLPTGSRSGVWAVDVDTAEDHADGVTEWNKLVAQHTRTRRVPESKNGTYHHHTRVIPALNTREHRSATDGPHLIFKWAAELPIGCSAGALPDGISVKGEGGYIVAPPSRRKGRSYTVFSDIDPTDAPQWLLDLILQGRSPNSGSNRSSNVTAKSAAADLDELADILSYIPNPDLPWEEWKNYGLRIYASNNQAFDQFDQFSQKSSKYDPAVTHDAWYVEITGSPPDRTGFGKLKKIARANGWVPKLRKAEPSYSMDGVFATADEARSKTQEVVQHFLAYDVACPEELRNVWIDYFFFEQKAFPPDFLPVRAMHVPPGIGKTRITIKELAKWIPKVKVGPIVYAVPRHKLGQKIEQQFAEHGIVAKVFRGRNADDPEIPDQKMCHNLAAVELAQRCHADITETCCKYKKRKCRFFDRCGYQRQQIGDMPDVWILAADMLFHTHKAFGEPSAVIIDEALWMKGLRGIEEDVDWSVAIDSLISKQDPNELDLNTDIGLRTWVRNWLGEVLMEQKEDGGVSRRLLADQFYLGKIAAETHFIIRREWACMPKLMQYPGMSAAAIKKLARANVIDEIAHSRRIIKIWEEIRNLIHSPEIAVSGRLTLKQKGGQRVVEWKGVAEISKQFRVPTLLLDATLPERSILEAYHPLVKIAADIEVQMPPYVRIHQIIEAPTSSTKLGNEKHIEEIRRYILKRWIETGCKPTLVICQMKVEAELHKRGLPSNVAVAHYNDIAGIDDYKDVRLLILVGRTAPGPAQMEDIAAALSGARPIELASGGDFTWYQRTTRGIRLPDGSGIATDGDLHPDPTVEAVRWQVHEGELIQALGRGRGVNRTAETPLDADLLFDAALPITVDKVSTWERPSLLLETAKDGIMPTAPADMVKLWPDIWPNEKAAYRTVQEGVPNLPGFIQVSYQLAGRNMKPRVAYFDPAIIHDPRAWLQTKLGPLAKAV